MTKIALSTNQAGQGSITLAAPNTNSDNTFTFPDATGTAMLTDTGVTTSQLPTGTVLQVVYGSDTTYQTTTSTTFVETGVTADITPSSTSSKILILMNLNGIHTNAANTYAVSALFRDGSNITAIDAIVGYTGTTNPGGGVIAGTYLDSPSTSSSVTYDIRLRASSAGTIVWNNYAGPDVSKSAITLLEIAA